VAPNNPHQKKKQFGFGRRIFLPSDYERIFVWVVYYVFGIVDWIMHWILLFACWLAAFVGFFLSLWFLSFLISFHSLSFLLFPNYFFDYINTSAKTKSLFTNTLFVPFLNSCKRKRIGMADE